MDCAAFVISLLALMLSVWVAIAEAKRDYKITKISIEFEFYREIYKDHLIKKVPDARSLMWIDKAGHVQDTKYLVEELNLIRRDSLYFLYNNKKFYEKLKNNLQQLEDYIITSEEKVFLGEDQTTFWNEIQTQLKKIYEVISQAYCGEIQ